VYPGSMVGEQSGRLTRRHFLRQVAGGAAGLVALPALSVLAACGAGAGAAGEDHKGMTGFTTEPAAQVVTVSAAADGTLAWDKEVYEARAGDVTFAVRNPSPVPHRFAVEGNGIKAQSAECKPGELNRYTLKGLQPGEYQLVCTYQGHREASMIARLIVA
jgi:uncharacterized cupredoxin-like copper-binding protein